MDNIRNNNPGLKVFDLSEGIDLLKSPEEEEEHDHHHHHHPGGVDPHTWSSISGAKVIAKNTLDAFVSLDPENKEYYQANYDERNRRDGKDRFRFVTFS